MTPPALAPAEKKQITRNRASYSCQTCRKRKIKCDKVHPICGNCSKSQDECVFSSNDRSNSIVTGSSPEETRQPSKKRKGAQDYQKESSAEFTSPSSNDSGGQESTNTPATNVSIENRLDRLTQLVEALSKGNGSDTVSTLVPEFGIRQERRNRSRSPLDLGKDVDDQYQRLSPIVTTSKRNRSRNTSAERLRGSPGLEYDIPSANSTDPTDPLATINMGYLSIQEGGRSRYVGSTFWAYISDELDQLNSLLRDQNRYSGTNGPATSSCAGDEEREPSPSSDGSDDAHRHGYSFHKQGDDGHHQRGQFRSDCEGCLRNSVDKSMLLQTMDSHPSRFRRMGTDVLVGMPTEKQSNILFRCWLSGVHGPCPMIYPPKALGQYEQFWHWYKNGRERGDRNPNPDYLPLLYAIWYAGSVSISIRGLREWFPGIKRAKLSSGFHDQITRCLIAANFPRVASIPSLAAFLTLQLICAREEEPLTSSLFIGLALRVAQMLGLHREPTLFDFEPWEVESRRRLWWHIVLADTMISVSSGLPPLISERYWDTKMISEVKDQFIGTPEGNKYEAAVRSGERPRDNPDEPTSRIRPSMVSVHNLAMRGRFVMACSVRRLLKIQLGTERVTRQDMEEIASILHDVEHDLNNIIKRIPTKGIPEMGFTPDRDAQGHSLVADFDHSLAKPPSEADLKPFLGMTPAEGLYDTTVQYHWNTLVAFHKWARIILSLCIDKVHCVAYVPFLKNAKSKMWITSRQCSLRHCHAFMRKFISLATDPAFQPFQWAWPGNHQPMHAAMIMLVDLYERPRSIEAPRSRALIDKIFSLSGPDGGIVAGEDGVTVQRPLREGGREAWDMLRRLRDKAWQKAGLDPNVLWTEDDQVRAGVAKPLTEADKAAQSLREDSILTVKTATALRASPFVMQGAHELLSGGGWKLETDTNKFGEQPETQAPTQEHPLEMPAQQEPAPFRFKVQKPPETRPVEVEPAGWNGHAPTSYGSIGTSEHSASNTSVPVPAMAPAVPYFNPATVASSSTQLSASTAAPTPSDNIVPDVGPPPTLVFDDANIQVPSIDGHKGSVGHFDWDQWDAVFGQHVPVDDVMTDVEWDNHNTQVNNGERAHDTDMA